MEQKQKRHQGSTVWHYYTNTGELIRRRLRRGQEPEAHWVRGFGPHSEEIRARLADSIRAVHLGKKTSAHTKQLMREAKLGVPKTPEHREAMRQAQLRRGQRRREERSE